jgi:hypothetical protein
VHAAVHLTQLLQQTQHSSLQQQQQCRGESSTSSKSVLTNTLLGGAGSKLMARISVQEGNCRE